MLASSARLLKLLTLLPARTSWSGRDLADRLAITERTVRRDVERLRELGYTVEASSGVGGGYRLGRGRALPPLVLDDEEAVAVAVSLRTAAGGTVDGIGDAAMHALAKLEQLLPSRLRSQVAAVQVATDSISAGTPTVDPSSLLQLALACRDEVLVSFGYVSHDGEATQRRVEPHRLVCTGRRWYLVARDVDRGGWRSFRVDRLHDVTSSTIPFVARDAPDAVEFVARGVSSAVYRYQASVRLAMPAERAAEQVSPATGVVVPVDEQSCELTTGADSLETIALHLALLECDFEVLAPPALGDAVQALAHRLLRASTSAGTPGVGSGSQPKPRADAQHGRGG